MPPNEQPLVPVSADALKTQLAVVTAPGDDGALAKKASEYADQLLSFTASDESAKERSRASVEGMGVDVQKQAARLSGMLKQPIGDLAKHGAEGGDVGNSLIKLKMKVEELDPAKFNFEPGFVSRTLGFLPGIGDPLKKYFTKYESGQSVISAIVASLEKGRDQLNRDTATLQEDQAEMRQTLANLARSIALGQLLDAKVVEKSGTLDAEKKKFADEEILFPLRQRLIDLQQQLAVSQQGVLAMELIVRNNRELGRGVNRALNVTVSALQVGVAVAVALDNQKKTLEKVQAISDTTSDMIAATAARLKTQGAAIQKQASSTTLNMDSLKSAFADIQSALDDISSFRTAALRRWPKPCWTSTA